MPFSSSSFASTAPGHVATFRPSSTALPASSSSAGGVATSTSSFRAMSSSAGGRPFRVLGVQQVAVGGKSKAALSNLWVDLLGCVKTGTFRSEKENVDEDILTLGSGPFAVEVDLMEPINPGKAPRVDSPPLNHIGLWVDDLKVAVDYLTEAGVRFTPGGIRRGAAGYDVVFMHPKGNDEFPLSGEGVLIELVQAPPDVIEAFSRL